MASSDHFFAVPDAMPVRWPLRYQILFPFAIVMLLALVAVSLLNSYFAARHSSRETVRQLRELARTLTDAKFPLTDTVLRQTHGLSGAEFVLADPQGTILAASRSGVELPRGVTVVPRDRLELGPVINVGADRYYHAAVLLPDRADSAEPGVLHILYPERTWREARWQAAFPPLVVGAVALAVVAILALAIAARLSRPILQLRGQVGRIAQGDFEALPLPERNDELRDLVGSVNALAGQLDEMQRVIKRSERLALLGQLSGGLAHHLRNDVTGARIAVQLHQRHCHDVDPESLAVALRQLKLTEEHLQRFLSAGRPQPPCRVDCDLPKMIDELRQLVEPACRHRRIRLETELDMASEPRLAADADQIRQLLLNLVMNAVDAVGSEGWVRLHLGESGGHLEVRVTDSGPGPPATVVERLFEPFATGKPEGIGLGLTVARQIAEAHGGSLRFERERFTSFVLRLPLADETEHDTENSAPVAVAGHSAGHADSVHPVSSHPADA